MFQFPGFAFLNLCIQSRNTCLTSLLAIPKDNNNKVSGGLPHSEIHGSKLILSSSWLIAEYHVFHRLLLPRHSPNALFALDLIQKKQGRLGPSSDQQSRLIVTSCRFNDLLEQKSYIFPTMSLVRKHGHVDRFRRNGLVSVLDLDNSVFFDAGYIKKTEETVLRNAFFRRRTT